MVMRSGWAVLMAFGAVVATGQAEAQTQAQSNIHTLQQALAAAYANNPVLQAERANLRATDERVPAALAGWRPQVLLTGSAGIGAGKTNSFGTTAANPLFGITGGKTKNSATEDRGETAASLTVTQPIYRGGKTKAATHQAENTVMATRAQLIATEQTVFTNSVSAYVNVISTEQVLALDINNEQVLSKQLQATNDRFRVGEITRTDVAQAEASLASARATRETAQGQVQTARATYEQLIGELPGKLLEPQPLKLPAATEQAARTLAVTNNPNVVSALYNEAAARDNFDLAYSSLMPNLSLQASAFRNENQQQTGILTEGGSVIATLSVPLYQGGNEYAAIRQARQQEQQARKQVDDARRTAVQQAVSSFQTYVAAKATIASNRAAIASNQVALEGTQREAIVGSRTTLDVLNAEQLLLNSRVTLVQSLANYVIASYNVAGAVGRLTARDLGLSVPYYDEKAYYTAVHDRWVGTGDFATDQPGR